MKISNTVFNNNLCANSSSLKSNQHTIRIKRPSQHRCFGSSSSKLYPSKLSNLINQFEVIDPELACYFERKYFGYFENSNESLEKKLDRQKLNTHYDSILRAYHNYRQVVKICKQLENSPTPHLEKIIKLEESLSALDKQRKEIEPETQKFYSLRAKIENLKKEKEEVIGTSSSANLGLGIVLQKQINDLQKQIAEIQNNCEYKERIKISEHINKIYLRTFRFVKRIEFFLDFPKMREKYEILTQEFFSKNCTDFIRGGKWYQLYEEKIGKPPHEEHLTYKECIELSLKLNDFEKIDFSKSYVSFIYLKEVLKENPKNVEQEEFYRHLNILGKAKIFTYKIKNIYKHSYEAQILIREQQLEKELKKLHAELGKFSKIDPNSGLYLKEQLSQAEKNYQQLSQACKRCDLAIEAGIQDPLQVSPEMGIVQDVLEKLIQQSLEIAGKINQFSQQIEEKRIAGRDTRALENQLVQLKKVLNLTKIISNCASFCTINNVQNHTVYMGSLFDDLIHFFIGHISKNLFMGEAPWIRVFKSPEQYEKEKKQFDEIKKQFESINSQDPSTFNFLTKLGFVAHEYRQFFKGGELYNYYEQMFGPSSNGRYLTKEECNHLKTRLKTRLKFRLNLNRVAKYQAFWVYGEQLNQPPIYYHQLICYKHQFVLEAHGTPKGTLVGESSAPLVPAEVAKQLRKYSLPPMMHLQFGGCFIAESIGDGNTGVERLMDALRQEGFYMGYGEAFEWKGINTHDPEDNLHLVRLKNTVFGDIYTDRSNLKWVSYFDPFTKTVRSLKFSA